MQEKQNMRRLNSTDVSELIDRFRGNSRGSLVTLASQFGMSQSELTQWLDDVDHQMFADFESGWLVELVEVDIFRSAIRFHLHGSGEVTSVDRLLALWQRQTQATKAYCYLFRDEISEQKCLQKLGLGVSELLCKRSISRKLLHSNGNAKK